MSDPDTDRPGDGPRDLVREGVRGLPAPPAANPGLATARPYVPEPPLVDPEPEQLRDAFVDNLFALFDAMSCLPGAVLERTSELSRHVAPPYNPMFAGAWGARLGSTRTVAAVAETEAWLAGHGASFGFWWVDRRTEPADLGALLESRGWTAWEVDAPGMAAPLDELRFDMLEAVPAGYVQRRAADASDLEAFQVAFAEGFGVPEWAGRAWVDATLSFGIGQAPWRVYVGWLDGRPVATTVLFVGAGVASVFGVATAVDVRGRGIGAAITLGAYADAVGLGYQHGVLFATGLGASVYRRMGFRDVEATVGRYLWRRDDG